MFRWNWCKQSEGLFNLKSGDDLSPLLLGKDLTEITPSCARQSTRKASVRGQAFCGWLWLEVLPLSLPMLNKRPSIK